MTGETGTGKEVLARTLHDLSHRTGAMVAVNCGAITDNLLEAYFFGHARGAFTGATRDEPGVVLAADGGTLFLDEISDLSQPGQVALLRVVQERQVVAVGTSRATSVNVRFMAAAQQPVQQLCDSGRLRPDLVARLDGFSYRLRPLRQRIEDLGTCIASILERNRASVTRVTTDVADKLLSYDWPANVRELEQCVLRAQALSEDSTVRARDLPPALSGSTTDRTRKTVMEWSQEDARTRRDLLVLMSEHRGNVTEIARAMGKARMQIQRWIKKFEIDVRLYRQGD